jgi:hypothetical protein
VGPIEKYTSKGGSSNDTSSLRLDLRPEALVSFKTMNRRILRFSG